VQEISRGSGPPVSQGKRNRVAGGKVKNLEETCRAARIV
jgi:hypothetical protein